MWCLGSSWSAPIFGGIYVASKVPAGHLEIEWISVLRKCSFKFAIYFLDDFDQESVECSSALKQRAKNHRSLDCRSSFLWLNKFDIQLKFIPRLKIHFKTTKEKCFLSSFRLINRTMLCEVAEMRSAEHTSQPWVVFGPSRWRQWEEAGISGPGCHCFTQLHCKTENDAKQKHMKVQVCFTTIASPQCRLVSAPFCSNHFYTLLSVPESVPRFSASRSRPLVCKICTTYRFNANGQRRSIL